MPFTMSKTVKALKRSNDDDGNQPCKIPRAGDIQVENIVPRMGQQRPNTGPVVVCIYKYTSNASDIYVDKYQDSRVGMYQIQFDQDCRNNIFFMFKKKFEEFLRFQNNEDGVCPTNLADLAAETGIDFKVSNGDNSKGIFVPWRVGAYVTGDIENVKNALLNCLIGDHNKLIF